MKIKLLKKLRKLAKHNIRYPLDKFHNKYYYNLLEPSIKFNNIIYNMKSLDTFAKNSIINSSNNALYIISLGIINNIFTPEFYKEYLKELRRKYIIKLLSNYYQSSNTVHYITDKKYHIND